MPYPVVADPDLRLRDELALPTFEVAGHTLYKRLALVSEAGASSRSSTRSSRRIETRPTSSRGSAHEAELRKRELRCRGGSRARHRGARPRAGLPHPPGVGVGRARHEVVRRDDEPVGRPARPARGERPVLDAGARPRGEVRGRDGEGALPHGGRAFGRGRADALPRRPPVGVPVVAVRLSSDLHLLRDRPDAVPPQPDSLGDPRPGAPFPPPGPDLARRLHGHGRADAQLRCRDRRRAAVCPISA